MSQSSVTTHPNVLEATAARLQQAFGDQGRTFEAAASWEGAVPQARHEVLRSKLEPRSPKELLKTNPYEAVLRRLRRLGLSQAQFQSAMGGGMDAKARVDAARIGIERILGRNELLAIRYLDAGRVAGRAVARVVIRSSSGAEIGYGTGSMISPSLIMTNNHVLESAARAGHAIVEFNYQLALDGQPLAPVRFRLNPSRFFTTSPEDELDVTIVAVDDESNSSPNSPLSVFGFNPLSAIEGEILAGESVTVIQHPGGDLKQIALRENRVLRLPDTAEQFLYYETDTTPGSSGAPVFNDQWEVVALHHSGFPERDSEGRLLTPDGQLWREEMGDERIHWIANEGIRVVAIREHLSGLGGLSLAQAALRDQALNPQPLPPVSEQDERRSPVQVRVPGGFVDGTPGSHGASGSAISWTIPLTVSVDLGTPVASQPAGGSAPVDTSSGSTPPLVTGPVDAASGDPDAADFEAAKQAFNEAQARPYYDATADAADRTSYYSGIANTLNPSELLDALSSLVRTTHTQALSYKPMVHLYPWVDLQPNLRIRSIYSAQTFDPVEFIARDFEVARLRRERLAKFKMSEAAASPTLEAAFVASLEADLPYNCEHVVPQSWFQKRQPMRGDLHHLFACESKCNSFRSNTPYFEFTDFREAIKSDCGKSETSKFEPNSGKGAVARATLYFLLRYPGEINSTSAEYTSDRIQTLLQWHQDHAVSDFERHRNQAIFAVQGNRNPLVDHPEFAAIISFERGLGSN